MNLFNTPYVKLLTQFLYNNYKKKIMRLLIPSYMINLFATCAH